MNNADFLATVKFMYRDELTKRCGRTLTPDLIDEILRDAELSLPELPAVETGAYTFDAAANAILEKILIRFNIPFEGDVFDSLDAIAEHISKLSPVETETCEEQCPVCGYYCLGNGGLGCIDKPSTLKSGRE